MKRYKIILGTLEDHPAISKARMIEDPNGEWVKWEDVEKETKEAYQSGYFTGQNSNKNNLCNCEEMANKPDYETHPDGLSPLPILLPPFWICPAHGYKRR